MRLGRFILRTAVGGLFVGHGTQKLFGWFDGHGLDATANGFESMGMRPGKATRSPPALRKPVEERRSRSDSPLRSPAPSSPRRC